MTRSALSLFATGLTVAGALIAQAPTDLPRILRIFREEIKPGRNAPHEKVETGYVRAFSKTKYANYIALESVTGPNEAWFIEAHDSYASIDNSIQIAEKALKHELAQLDMQDGELRAGGRSLIATYQKPSSYRAAPLVTNMPKMRYMTVQTVRVRPGRGPDYIEMLSMVNTALDKMNVQQPAAVYSVSSGAPAGTYLIFRPVASLKDMDPPATPVMTFAQAMGEENLAKFRKLQAEIILTTESALFSLNPRMSHVSKDFAAGDPDFWTPKPKAPAAKPSAAQ